MTWLEDCRPKINLADLEHWSLMIKRLNGSTFVKYVDPVKGEAIMYSTPVQTNVKDWSAFVEGKKDQRTRILTNMMKGDRRLAEWNHDVFNLLSDPADLEAGGTTSNVMRLRAIAQVMKDELDEINNAWLAQIMEACTGIPYSVDRVRKRIQDMK